MKSLLKRCALVAAAVLALAVLALVVQHHFARPDIRAFDPQSMGRMESAMWRSYYERHWVRLGSQTMRLACGQYGLSWWDGARMSAHAAISAMHFRKNTNDPRCFEELVSYYRIVQHGVPSRLNVEDLASLELKWWKERRRHVPPDAYARTIAQITASVYGIPEAVVLPAARLRTAAMAYRDARRDEKMTEADWSEVSRQLIEAYTLLKRETGTPL